MKKQKPVHILDTTIRDGGYAIDFQFTPEDIAFLCGILDEIGLEYIEIGHGLGLGANKKYKSTSFHDEEYLEAARRAVKRAKIGMFFIPDIGTAENIITASRLKMDFIRVGTDVDKLSKAEKYIKLAKSKGMMVCSNLMKSYLIKPAAFAKKVKLAQRYGSDVVYLVDSAGGMLPEDVEEYMRAVFEETDGDIGFHGHDNLGLANANTIKAVDAGAAFVDVSLKGMGRSAGNASTEIMVSILEKRGIGTGIDLAKLLTVSDTYMGPLLNKVKRDGISVALGFSQIHSSNLNKIMSFAQQAKVSPHEILLKLKGYDKSEVSDKVLEDMRKTLRRSEPMPEKGNVLTSYPREVMTGKYINCSLRSFAKMTSYMDSIANKLSLKKALIVDIKEELPANAVISTYLFHNEFVVSGKLEVHGKEELLYVLTNKKDFDFDAYIVESGNLAEDALGDLKRDILDIDPKSCVGFYRREDLKSEFLVGWLNNPSGRKDAGSVIIYSPFLGLVKALTERCHSLREIYLVDENFERLWDIQKACAPGKNIFILTPDERPQNLDIEARFFAVLSDTAFSKYPHLFKFLQKDGEIIIFDNAEIPQKTDYLLKQKKIKVVKGDISIFMASKIYETLRMKTFD